MREGTIYVQENNGNVSAIGIWLAPSAAEVAAAHHYYTFRNDNYRVHALVVSGTVTMEQCRECAQKFVEGRSRRINFSEEAARFGIRSIS